MKKPEQIVEALITEGPDNPLEFLETMLADVDRYVTGHLEHEVGVLKDALQKAHKDLAGMRNAGVGQTEHDTHMTKVIMPAWIRFESQVTELGRKFKALDAAVKKEMGRG